MKKQLPLFNSPIAEIDMHDGRLAYQPGWLSEGEAGQLFTDLKQQVIWQQSIISICGKPIKIPRLNAWYGDKSVTYEYSGHRFQSQPWLPCLWQLKKHLEQQVGHSFNSVLLNYYRNGHDSVTWHSDDEPELGQNPVIASISLGAERVFQFRHRCKKRRGTKELVLADGSLLLMLGALQHHWQHQLPKSNKPCEARINLTYRYVFSEFGE